MNIEKRNLQLEVKARIAVQQWIDEGGLRKPVLDAGTVSGKNALTLLALVHHPSGKVMLCVSSDINTKCKR